MDGLVQAPSLPLPTSLDGLVVEITDSAQAVHLAELIAANAIQVNYIVPPGVALGPAQVRLLRNGEELGAGSVNIEPVAPGLFSADGTGAGVAAATFILVASDGTRTAGFPFDPSTRQAVPLTLGEAGDELYLSLFGTGVRGFQTLPATTVGEEPVPVLAAGPQSEFPGLDQINIGPLPHTLIGRGEVDIVITVDGKVAAVVTVTIE